MLTKLVYLQKCHRFFVNIGFYKKKYYICLSSLELVFVIVSYIKVRISLIDLGLCTKARIFSGDHPNVTYNSIRPFE